MFIFLFTLTVITFAAYGANKYYAKKGLRRISENTLLFLAALGGSLGAMAGMFFFRHKTQKQKFTIGVPLLLTIQIIYIFIIYGLN